jgi:hypothetical protein
MSLTPNSEREALLDRKEDARTSISAEGKARDELLDKHSS